MVQEIIRSTDLADHFVECLIDTDGTGEGRIAAHVLAGEAGFSAAWDVYVAAVHAGQVPLMGVVDPEVVRWLARQHPAAVGRVQEHEPPGLAGLLPWAVG
jgi:hypothetical protein